MSNAVRYTPPGGTITLAWRVDADGRGVFSVRDTGIGIAPEHVPRLTERFYRVDRSRSRATGGTGLGLAIVKHVLLRHQAELDIDERAGRGQHVRGAAAEQLANSANPDAYSVREVIVSEAFLGARCLAVVRYAEPTPDPERLLIRSRPVDMLAIWRIDRPSPVAGPATGFVLSPVYLRATNSIAVAAPPSKPDGFPRMNLAMAMSLRMIGQPPSTQLPVVHTLGPAESTFKDVDFGCRTSGTPAQKVCAKATTSCLNEDDACKSSDLVPLPPPGTVVSITVSIAEQGDAGIDFDLAKAQLAALREVLGSTAKAALEARFGE